MRLILPLLAFAVVALAAYAPSPAPVAERALAPADTQWSWPDNPQNLQVLPEGMGGEELGAIMRGFTRSLGVRCHHCHVGEEGQDFLEWDFASDAKDTKEVARAMMNMTWQINNQTLPAIDGLHHMDGPPESPSDWLVTCWTCHRGETHPAVSPPPRDATPQREAEEDEDEYDDDHEHDDHDHDHDDD